MLCQGNVFQASIKALPALLAAAEVLAYLCYRYVEMRLARQWWRWGGGRRGYGALAASGSSVTVDFLPVKCSSVLNRLSLQRLALLQVVM